MNLKTLSSLELQRKAALEIQSNPSLFIRKILDAELKPYQNTICKTIIGNKRTAIAACHALGKSWTMARIVLQFGACFPNSKIITTAPSYNQVKNILWSEIRTAYQKSKFPLGGVMLQTEWKINTDHFALGFTPRNENVIGEGQGTASSFQGFHAEHILVIFDEATGIPHNIWNMAEGLLTSANVRFVAIGNPTSRQSQFYKCFSFLLWAKIYLSCFDSINLKANNLLNIKDLEREIDFVRTL